MVVSATEKEEFAEGGRFKHSVEGVEKPADTELTVVTKESVCGKISATNVVMDSLTDTFCVDIE
jgi:hypothetical protein